MSQHLQAYITVIIMMCVSQVRQDILNCGLMPKDIRLIRKKDTGNYHYFCKLTSPKPNVRISELLFISASCIRFV